MISLSPAKLIVILIFFMPAAHTDNKLLRNPFTPVEAHNSRTNGELVIRGIIEVGKKRTALLAKNGRSAIVQQGDQAFGCKVIAIETRAVIVHTEAATLTLQLEG